MTIYIVLFMHDIPACTTSLDHDIIWCLWYGHSRAHQCKPVGIVDRCRRGISFRSDVGYIRDCIIEQNVSWEISTSPQGFFFILITRPAMY